MYYLAYSNIQQMVTEAGFECSSQSRVLFSLQQHTTTLLAIGLVWYLNASNMCSAEWSAIQIMARILDVPSSSFKTLIENQTSVS